jgi:hypothetical protein
MVVPDDVGGGLRERGPRKLVLGPEGTNLAFKVRNLVLGVFELGSDGIFNRLQSGEVALRLR